MPKGYIEDLLEYLRLTGGTLTGDLIIEKASPSVYLKDTTGTYYRITSLTNMFIISKYNTGLDLYQSILSFDTINDRWSFPKGLYMDNHRIELVGAPTTLGDAIRQTTKITEANVEDAVDKKHAQAHTLASHSTKAHSELTGVTADQHHAQSHNAASHSDITSSGANIDDAVTKKHSQNTDNDLSPAHKDASSGVHGVGASTVASVANIATHAALTATHGVSTIDGVTARNAAIATHAAITTGIHGLDSLLPLSAGSTKPLSGDLYLGTKKIRNTEGIFGRGKTEVTKISSGIDELDDGGFIEVGGEQSVEPGNVVMCVGGSSPFTAYYKFYTWNGTTLTLLASLESNGIWDFQGNELSGAGAPTTGGSLVNKTYCDLKNKIVWKDTAVSYDVIGNVGAGWTDLDLTNDTSSNAKYAIVNLLIRCSTLGTTPSNLALRKNGTTPDHNPGIFSQVVNFYNTATCIIGLDTGQILEYILTAGTGATLNIAHIRLLGYIE